MCYQHYKTTFKTFDSFFLLKFYTMVNKNEYIYTRCSILHVQKMYFLRGRLYRRIETVIETQFNNIFTLRRSFCRDHITDSLVQH